MQDNNDSYRHHDGLAFLNDAGSLEDKLIAAHAMVRRRLPYVARIAIALYDRETAVLKTFVHSSGGESPLDHYEAALADAPSLAEILRRGQPRVIDNMLTFEDDAGEHTRRLGRHGYAASYTMPIFHAGRFLGFIFFNAVERNAFTEEALEALDVYGHLIALMVIAELAAVTTLEAAVKTTGRITHVRDPETGSHLDRMSRFSRLIAQALSARHSLDDDYIEHVFMFSPLHDIGKIAIPDDILRKPAALTTAEMDVMRTHTTRGQEMLEELIENFGLRDLTHVDVLRNIAASHHEAVNGTGYPDGKAGEAIPLEARIVAVADVFDALTSKRPYKDAWSNERAYRTLLEMAGEKLDRDCVDALIAHREEVEEIQRHFREKLLD